MKKRILIAPSILSADFTRLKEEIKKVENSGADMIHIDVMDGFFVPNLTIGPLIVEAVRRTTDLPLDVHLMIEEPHRFIKEFVDAGSDIITVHAEVYGKLKISAKDRSRKVERIDEERLTPVLNKIKSFGKRAGVSLNPDSPFCIEGILHEVDMILIMSVHPGFGGQLFIETVLPKIKKAREVFSGDIEIDGGINEANIKSVVEAGANVIVVGSYFFSSQDPKLAVKKLRII